MITLIDEYQSQSLVSLEEALHPMVGLIPDIQRYVKIAKYNFRDYGDGLTQDEFAAILIFTMEWAPDETCLYRVINETLRLEDPNKLKPWMAYLKLFLAALHKLPPYEGLVWRHIEVDVHSDYEQGKRGTWWSITSTTIDTTLFNSKYPRSEEKKTRTLFLIDCLHGKCIEKYSMFPKEKEIVLMPGFHFETISKINLGGESFMINIKEKEAPFQLFSASCCT